MKSKNPSAIVSLIATISFIFLTSSPIFGQFCPESNLLQNTNNSVSGHSSCGQSFTATCNGQIVSVTVVYNTVPVAQNRILNIYDGDTCLQTIIHTQLIPSGSIVSGANTFVLTTPVPINSGEVNAWEVTDATPTNTAGNGISFNSGGAYSAGRAWFSCQTINNVYDITFEVNIQTGASVSLGSDTTICPGQTLVLDADTGFVSYNWSNGDTNQTTTVDTAGIYWVMVIDTSGDTATDTLRVNMFTPQTVNLGPDQSQCPGQTNCITADSGAVSYNWSTGDTTQSICVTQPGVYSVALTDANGCTNSDSTAISAVPNPVVNLGADQDLCLIDSICFNANGGPGASYLWNGSLNSNVYCTTTPQTISLNVTDSNGCVGSDTVVVTQNNLPVASIAQCDTSNCPTIAFTDGSSNANSWLWKFGDGGTSVQQNPTWTYGGNTTFNVVLLAENFCGLDSILKSVEINCLAGLHEVSNWGVQVYPNPNHGKFVVSIDGIKATALTVQLYNVSGKSIFERHIQTSGNKHVESFDFQGLSEGLYFLKLQADGQESTRKIIIQEN